MRYVNTWTFYVINFICILILPISTRKKRAKVLEFRLKGLSRYSARRCSLRLSSYAIKIPRDPRYAVIIRRFTESSSEWRRRWEDSVKSFAHEIGRLSFSLQTLFFQSGSAIPPRASSKKELLRLSLPFAEKKVNLRLYQRIAKAYRIEEREVIIMEKGSTYVSLILFIYFDKKENEN